MSSTRTIYLFVNGIQTWPGDAKNWNKRAVTWIHQNTPHHAQNDEYFTTALTVWIHGRARALAFADLLEQFRDWRIIIVAHSNGTKVAIEALRLAHRVTVEALHLVSGACDGNFERNGLNAMLRGGRIGRVYVYWGGKDRAMRFEDTLTGKALFGVYAGDKPLGLGGPQAVARDIAEGGDRVVESYWKGYGHSTWWLPRNFDRTMNHFIQTRGRV